MEETVIRQGDQYSIPFTVMLDGSVVTPDVIDSVTPEFSGDIEIIIGRLRKTYRKNEIKFNRTTFTFDFPLTQKETFALRGGMRLQSQVRVKLRKFNADDANTIYSYDGPIIRVLSSLSREQI